MILVQEGTSGEMIKAANADSSTAYKGMGWAVRCGQRKGWYAMIGSHIPPEIDGNLIICFHCAIIGVPEFQS
ncbi:UNVERIFIED_CONTAM: hypothetical protein Sangu_0320300 [Sesamum angustifolium]|uniref:Uncharacterized protein n=1 Tax=Sesamum angustifolium TaxID=2727405 RepID=A0AAW2QR55_9LAMI